MQKIQNQYFLLYLQFALLKSLNVMVSFQNDGVELPSLDYSKISRWLTEVAAGYDRRIGDLVYRFCSDEIILKTNNDFLHHNYYTDVITFDYSIGKRVGADVLISLDTVRTNAENFGVCFKEELLRVIVHGLLHLCGLKDKSPEERTLMESAEDKALAQYSFI